MDIGHGWNLDIRDVGYEVHVVLNRAGIHIRLPLDLNQAKAIELTLQRALGRAISYKEAVQAPDVITDPFDIKEVLRMLGRDAA